MFRLLNLSCVVLAVILFFSVSANVVIYSVTFVSCVPGSTCPQGNLLKFNQTFALNGTLSPNLTLNVGDTLQFDLVTNVPIHPLTICQNSTVPNFCGQVANSSLLSTPINVAGTNTSVMFTTAGTYYYGCHNHPGMGATINVTQTANTTSSSTRGTGVGYQLAASVFLAALFPIILI
jgi:hypothetical protein